MGRTPKDGRYMKGFAERLGSVLVSKHRCDFELGKMIHEVTNEELFLDWPTWGGGPYKSFADWSWNVLHFKVGKATALRRIYLDLTALSPTDDTISRALRIGWTKLYLILRVARTPHALEKWIARVEEHKLTELDLRVETMEVKPEERKRKKRTPDAASAHGKEEPDAELEEAAEETAGEAPSSEPEVQTPIPDRPSIPEPVRSREVGDGEPPEDDDPVRRYKWPLVFEDAEALRIFKDGLKLVVARYPEIGPGRAAALMATHYMASMARDDEGGAAVELNTIIEAIERTYGVTLEVKRQQPKGRSRSEVASEF